MTRTTMALLTCVIGTWSTACPGDDKRPLGGSCSDEGDCLSGLCGAGVCLDPASDDDRDGVINAVEVALGSNPKRTDSDDDGADDGDELADDQSGVDTDGDSRLDIIESRLLDQDDDCIPDQFDAEDGVANSDLSPMRDVVCRAAGLCTEQREALGVTCPDGHAVCLYDHIEGFADPEVACDTLDENCDGTVDEGFPAGCVDLDWDDDGIEDLVDVCPETPDADQDDGDDDGVGDACRDLYTLAFSPLPPTRVVAGEAFAVSGRVVRKGEPRADGELAAPLPNFRGEVALGTVPAGGVASDPVIAEAGAFTFSDVLMTTAGTWRLALTSALGTTESAPLDVIAAPPESLSLSVPERVTAGVPFTVTAQALDRFGNPADLASPATFTADDPGAGIPAPGAFLAGSWSLDGVVLQRAGLATLRIAAGTLAGEATTTVTPGPATAIAIAWPETARAGTTTTLTVSAVDTGGNVAESFVGTVTLAIDDPRAVWPSTLTFTAQHHGTRTIDVTIRAAGLRTVTATSGDLSGEAAHLVLGGAPYTVTLASDPAVAGVPSPLRVAIVDVDGNVADDPSDSYAGTVTLTLVGTPPAPPPLLPEATTFTAADRSAIAPLATWYRAGTFTVRAVATALARPTTTAEVTVVAGPLAALAVTLPATAKVDIPADLTVTARDAHGNVVVGFVGTIALTDDDDASDLPDAIDLGPEHAGTRTLAVRFATTGARTVTASAAPFTAEAITTVRAGAPHRLTATAPAAAIAGVPWPLHVAIVDARGNVADDPADSYRGRVTFAVLGPLPDPPPTLPPAATFTAAELSERDLAATWYAAGAASLRVTGANLAEPSATLDVAIAPASAASLRLVLPTLTKAGLPVELAVEAIDTLGNLVPSFTGTVSLTVDDPDATLAASIDIGPEHGGRRTLPVAFGTSGKRTVAATSGTLTGAASSTVRAGSPVAIALTVPGPANVGVVRSVHVAIVDAFGNVADDPADLYLGSVAFDIAGPQPPVAPTLPAPITFTAASRGERDVNTTWFSAGTWTLRATGTNLATPTATAPIQVVPAPATRFELTLPATIKAGVPTPLTITARDAGGFTASGFIGTALLAVDDPNAVLPTSITFAAADAGRVTVQAELRARGPRVITATSGAITGQAATTVLPGAPHALQLVAAGSARTGAPLSVHVAVLDAFGNIAADPAAPYLGTVTFDLVGAAPSPPPILPGATPYSFADLSERDVATTWFRPGTFTLRATGTGLPIPSATTPIDVLVSPATAFTLTAPATFVAGTSPSATATAVDAWGNTDPEFAGTAALSGSSELPSSLGFSGGVRTFPLTLTIAGDYLVALDAGERHGERALTVTHAAAYKLVAQAPEHVVVNQNLTATLYAKDRYDNVVTNYVGPVDLTSATPNEHDEPLEFTLPDLGALDFSIAFFELGLATVDLTSGISPEGATSFEVMVLSATPDQVLIGDVAGPVEVGVPFGGVVVSLADDGGALAAAPVDTTVTLSLGMALPGPAVLSGALTAIIPAGHSTAIFDDLTLDRDGRFALTAATTSFGAATSAPFEAHHRAPTVAIAGVVTDRGCTTIDYHVDQIDGAAVDVLVDFGPSGEDAFGHASQGASGAGVHGTHHLPAGADYRYLWNTTRDITLLGTTAAVDIRVRARAGSLLGDHSWNPWGEDTVTANLDLGPALDLVSLTAPVSLARTDFAAADIDRDGLVDVAFTTAEQLHVVFSDGTTLATDPEPGADVTRVALGDLDGLGDTSAALVDAAGNTILLYDMLGPSAIDSFDACPGGQPIDVALADVDRRAPDDVVVVCADGGGDLVWEVWTRAISWSLWKSGAGAGTPTALAVADLEKDGVSDLVIGTTSGIAVVSGTDTNPPFLAIALTDLPLVATSQAVVDLAVRDLDWDGRDDAVAVDTLGAVWRLQGVPGGSLLDPPTQLDAIAGPMTAVALGDVDGDRRVDLVLAPADTHPMRVGLQTPDGDFTWRDLGAGAPLTRLATAGDEILGMTPGPATTNAFALLDASPAELCQPVVDAVMATPPWPDAQVVAFADFNGDGKLDLAGESGRWGARVAYGRGDGGFFPFAESVGFDSGAAVVVALATGDLDHDGATDLALSRSDGVIDLWASDTQDLDPSSGFVFLTSLSGQTGANPIAAADLDGDRHDDLAFVDADGTLSIAYQDVAAPGTFDVEAIVAGAAEIRALDVVDGDSRGDLDLVYYRREAITPVDHWLCTARASGDAHSYDTPRCTSLVALYDLTPEERAALVIDGLVAEDNPTASRRAYYRFDPVTYIGHIEARELTTSDGTPGPASTVALCQGSSPRAFALGDFAGDPDPNDTLQDVAATCFGESGASLEVMLLNPDLDPNHRLLGPIDLGAGAPLVAADFDGDDRDDLASDEGAILLRDEDGLVAQVPDRVEVATGLDEVAVIAGDFTGDRVGDLLVAALRYDGSDWYLALTVDSPAAGIVGSDTLFERRLCSDCASDLVWRVHLAKGDLDGDGLPELLVAAGSLAANGALLTFACDLAGHIAELPALGGGQGLLGFVPEALAVGAWFNEAPPDVAVAGTSSVGTPVLELYTLIPDGFWETYRAAVPADLPDTFGPMFIGDVDPTHGGPELALIDTTDGWRLLLFADDGGCEGERPDCLELVGSAELISPITNYSSASAGAADFDGDGLTQLVVAYDVSSEGNGWQEAVRFDWSFDTGELLPVVVAHRGYDVYPCGDGPADDCFERALRPLTPDLDHDGLADLLIGWRHGGTWEAFPSSGPRRMFGATASERGDHAVFADLDHDGLGDVILFDRDSRDILILGRRARP